ncbi:M1 family metalloprotease precursor [Flavobacterium limnosediminis JC2902]|uniref:Aminopeptidase N n=1 Tax=Flavobacterium limnosediminis JC2902 TaxID=1341181 RepID=V6SQV8_9FLAO|nr:M1 family aminopeptidase [Flavobacterium limnosediminis]ESU29078.1 M1 family metalloprotease precursor [Flavobacterium limnosediminis JC2902]
MKKFALLFALLVTYTGFSQTHDEEYHRMIEAEMKSASKTMNFRINPNTQNYDITYHKLEFTVDPAVYFISGVVTTTFTAISNMSTVTFDLTNQLTVSSVKQGITNLTFVQNANNELVITLPATVTAGNSATVTITYSGAPATGEQAFTTSTHNGTPVLWTLSEPFGARDWWPCKQDLNDKVANMDVYITAPSAYTSVSNGLEQSQTINGANKTTHFHHDYPIPAYLVAIAATNYQVYNQQGGLGTTASPYFPIVNYIYPETASSTQTSLAITPAIINLFESLVGPYPFRNEKYGHAQFGWGGGMEHTTVSFMGGWNRGLIAHEMAHQWFGDKVTCGTWKDIWLNEGITEYMSGLVVENLDGASNFVSWKTNKINNITSQPNGNLYLSDTQSEDVNRIFSSRISYDKGSMVTHMLRNKIGDTNFFQGLRNYLNDPALAYGYATTPQFKAHMETVSGINLTEFFNDWIYMQGYPTYTVNAQNLGGNQLRITLNQTSSHISVPFFEAPVPIRLTGAGGQTYDAILNNTSNGQQFLVTAPFTPTGILFDPNKHIISKNSTATLGNSSFELDQIISLYPNPSNDRIAIQLPATIQLEKAEIYNSLGQLTATETNAEFSVSALSDGVHIVKITTSEGVIHKNFIKK